MAPRSPLILTLLGLLLQTSLSLAASKSIQGPTYSSYSVSEKVAERQKAELMALKRGDYLRFSNGQEFQIDRVLGSGTSTVVFSVFDSKTGEVDPARALRVASDTNSIRMMKSFVDGYQALKDAGIPVVEILEVGRAPGVEHFTVEYIVVERISDSKDRISMGEFLNRRYRWQQGGFRIPDKLHAEMRQSLIEFVVAAKDFRSIGDFAFSQMGYDPAKKSWVLFDWINQHLRYPTAPGEPSRFIREIEARFLYDLDIKPNRNTEVGRYVDDLLNEMTVISSRSGSPTVVAKTCSALFR